MNEHEDHGGDADLRPPAAETGQAPSLQIDDPSIYERVIPRVLRNLLVASVLLLGPALWFYHWAGAIGFAFGAAVSYANFRSLATGVEGLADRIVNRNSQ
jgi:hypothetical protein